MDSNIIECDHMEGCLCRGDHSLDILGKVQKMYEEKLDDIEKIGGAKKLQMQVELLRSWVSDLVSQNALLTRAVEELETEATALLMEERRRHTEISSRLHLEAEALRRRLRRKDCDLAGLIEVLRRLRDFDCFALEGIHFFEVTEKDIFGTVDWDVSKKDVEVMAGMCCTGHECGDMPVKDFDAVLREEAFKFQERILKIDFNLKAGGVNVQALREVNVSLVTEVHMLRHLNMVISEQCLAVRKQSKFRDEIIREMRRQLKHAKDKIKQLAQTNGIKATNEMKENLDQEYPLTSTASIEALPIACVRQQPRRRLASSLVLTPRSYSLSDCRSASGDCEVPGKSKNNTLAS